MRIYGVIAEYNPLHEGHRYHLREARRRSGCDALVVVMSGPFVQRGEPAVADPLTRARWAVGAGADLVLELPAAYACHGAQLFARGGVGLLTALGCVEGFCFGCEAEDPTRLTQIANLLAEEPPALSQALRAHLAAGDSFPRARQQALAACLGEENADLLTLPNNVLALEYLQACRMLGSPLAPLAVRREGGGYRDTTTDAAYPSAAAIRAALAAGKKSLGLPAPVAAELIHPLFPDSLGPLLRWHWAHTPPETLAETADMSEGLHLRLIRAARERTEYGAILDAAMTRRYSRPRLQRALLHGLLGLTRADSALLRAELPLFIRPLALGEKGPALLAEIARACPLPLITRPARYQPEEAAQTRLWALNEDAWALYAALSGRPVGWEKEARLSPLPCWKE